MQKIKGVLCLEHCIAVWHSCYMYVRAWAIAKAPELVDVVGDALPRARVIHGAVDPIRVVDERTGVSVWRRWQRVRHTSRIHASGAFGVIVSAAMQHNTEFGPALLGVAHYLHTRKSITLL